MKDHHPRVPPYIKVLPDREENHVGAAEETGPEENAGPKQSRQLAHPRIANEVQIERIIDGIKALGPLTCSKASHCLTFVGILRLSLS